jgi:hypothetical protein
LRHERAEAAHATEAAIVQAERARAQAKVDAVARKRADELEQRERELERRERANVRALELRSAALAHEQHMKECWFRVRRGMLSMGQKHKAKVLAK